MEDLIIREPQTEEEFEEYYHLRWEILRKPWNQPRGSEKDERERESIHIMAIYENKVVGVGRGHFNSREEGQIRYMAVEESYRNRGIGSSLLLELEKRLKERGAKYIVLNARENAVEFYRKHGYIIVGKAHTLFNSIHHFKMMKKLE